ncbi:hypothetical protein KKB10_06040 [Patescibacteria group bacterium]|nr:hypothetical protein [Patescibacteria group bacterium]MBU1951779.1 hypothetical protein [Patescibacteria group bacterium]
MDIKNIILFIVSALNFTLASIIYLKNPKSGINISFGSVILCAGIWSLGIAMFRYTNDVNIALWWARIYYIAAGLIAFFFLFFSIIFPYKSFIITKAKVFAILIPFLLVIIIIFIPDFMIGEITINTPSNEVTLQSTYVIYTMYFLTYMAIGFFFLITKYASSQGIHRIQLQYTLKATAAATFFGATFNLILPMLGNYKLIWLGPDFTLITFAYMSYYLFFHKHNI